jgi:hypothetical protein
LPWIHLATRPNGDVRLCCTANASGAGIVDSKEIGLVTKDGVTMNLRDHTIEEVWNSEFMRDTRLEMLNGKIPNSCQKCFKEESLGIKSKRNWETIVWNERIDIESIVKQTDVDGSLPVNIPYFDLRLGNLCNLKCVMCSPHDSSSWIKDWKIQTPQYTNPALDEGNDASIVINNSWTAVRIIVDENPELPYLPDVPLTYPVLDNGAYDNFNLADFKHEIENQELNEEIKKLLMENHM